MGFLVTEMLQITKEKNTTVKSSAEFAIVEVLNLRSKNHLLEVNSTKTYFTCNEYCAMQNKIGTAAFNKFVSLIF